MEENENTDINVDKLPDDFRNFDPNFDPKLRQAFKTLGAMQNFSSNTKLHKGIAENFRTQVKIKKSILGRLFPSLVKNRKFIEMMSKFIAATNRLTDFLHQYIPGKVLLQPIAAIVMVLFLITIGVVTYSFYNGNKNNSSIANNPTPISTSKSTANNPTHTPNPSANPNIVENHKTNENNKLNGNPENNNNVNVAKNSNKSNKLNNIKKNPSNTQSVKVPNSEEKNDVHKEEIANTSKDQKNISIEQASSERGITVKNLKDLFDLSQQENTIYIDESINTELRNELTKALEATGKFTIVTDSTKPHNLIFRWLLSKPNTIALGSDFNPMIWSKFVAENTPEEQAKNIVTSLLEVLQSVKKQN